MVRLKINNILLHTCCAPCATYSIEQLRKEGAEVSAFWFNPNIHPLEEYQKRLQTLRSFAAIKGLATIENPIYNFERYFQEIVGKKEPRCEHCYYLRLSRTAEAAVQGGFKAFSTTLLISPYQRHELVKEIGEHVSREKSVEFYYEDLRPGYYESRKMSRELNLYRQKYCGCIYSKLESYRLKNIAKY